MTFERRAASSDSCSSCNRCLVASDDPAPAESDSPGFGISKLGNSRGMPTLTSTSALRRSGKAARSSARPRMARREAWYKVVASRLNSSKKILLHLPNLSVPSRGTIPPLNRPTAANRRARSDVNSCPDRRWDV